MKIYFKKASSIQIFHSFLLIVKLKIKHLFMLNGKKELARSKALFLHVYTHYIFSLIRAALPRNLRM